MKQLFDDIKESLKKVRPFSFVNGREALVYKDDILRIINEAEAKWNEDVCEWEDTKIGVFHIKTTCSNWIETNYAYEFCPYCGKKIKVV